MTHTLDILEISAEAYDEICGVLDKAGLLRQSSYHADRIKSGVIDMGGLGLERGEPSTDVQENLSAEIAGGDETLEAIEEHIEHDAPIDVELHRKGNPKIAHFPIIPDTYPCVCYFYHEEDRRYFMEEVESEEETVKVVLPDTSRGAGDFTPPGQGFALCLSLCF